MLNSSAQSGGGLLDSDLTYFSKVISTPLPVEYQGTLMDRYDIPLCVLVGQVSLFARCVSFITGKSFRASSLRGLHYFQSGFPRKSRRP